MNRRTYLGSCAGVGVAALAGCLDAVGSRVARTEAVPAILQWGGGDCDDGDVCVRPHIVRALDEEIDSGNPALGTLRVRGWLGGSQLVAANYNNTRSNRSTVRSDADSDDDADGDGVDDGTEDGEGARANYNNTRSNRSGVAFDEGDGSDASIDLERAFEYLDDDDDGDGVLVGETFVVTAPVVDLPGVADPAAKTGHADYVKNMVTGARRASPTGEETVLRGLTTPTQVKALKKGDRVSKRMDQTTPVLYQGLSSPTDDDSPMAGDWSETSLRGETSAPDQSEPAIGRCVATLDGGVKLPVLVWTQHLVHEGDHLFVAGWVLDEARLYDNAATVLTASGRTNVGAFGTEMGQVHATRNADGEPVCRCDPTGTRDADGEPTCRCDPTREAALAAAVDARRGDGGGTDHGWAGLFVVPMDAPLVHDRKIVREVGKKK
jgi:hypothetical protein